MTKHDEIQENHINTLHEYYKNGNTKALAHLAMRYGKTKLSIEIFKKILPFHATILISYPDNKIKSSWEEECIKWEYINPNITYVNFSSLWKYKDMIFDFVLCDEVHSLSENELDILHQLITNDDKMLFLGLSGTMSKETQEKIGIPIVVEYSTLSGIQDGILASYQISVHLVNLDTKITTKNKAGKEKTEKQRYDGYTWVIDKIRRQGGPTMHLALARNRLSLSSIGKTEYLKSLLSKMKDKRVIIFTGLAKVADGLGIPSYHSKSKDDFSFHAFQNKHINRLALAAMGKMGVTYKELDSVILLNFTYNAEETSQILNRAIKLDYAGKIADLHIICLNEPPELKKIEESLSMLDKTKIKYV